MFFFGKKCFSGIQNQEIIFNIELNLCCTIFFEKKKPKLQWDLNAEPKQYSITFRHTLVFILLYTTVFILN